MCVTENEICVYDLSSSGCVLQVNFFHQGIYRFIHIYLFKSQN